VELVSLPNRETRTRRLLTPLRPEFDYIFIDTPPSLGLLTLNALVAADAVLIPLNCEYFALEGLADLVATLRRVRASLNPSLDIAGVLMTMYDERTNLGQQVARDIRAFFQERVYETVIPRNIRLGRRRATACPPFSTTRDRAGPRHTSRWPASCGRGRAPPPPHRSSSMAEKRPALGRGLSALIPDAPAAPAPQAERPLEVDIDLLRPNRFQPRTHMDEDRIEELARSIRANGIIQPIAVRKVDGGFEIIAGERRWRASQRAGLHKVPVVLRDVPEERLLAVALIENIQREDLNPIEEAHAYRRLASEFSLTQEQIAEAVGKDRSSVANYLRLLRLPGDVREHVASGALSMGHARAILGLTDEGTQSRVAADVLQKTLSVRETEALVKRMTEPAPEREAPQKDVHTRAAEERLRFTLGTRVRIVRKGKGGRIEVDFGDENELQRLYEQLTERS
jgi:ParB family chromosome partitioning protein